jgi:hypothetical protein
MAMTTYKEKNRVHWIGVRPAIIGEQISLYGSATNGTTLIYTVPADKMLLLFNDWAGGYWPAAAGGSFSFFVRNAADVEVFRILSGGLTIAGTLTRDRLARYIPFEVQEGFDVCISSDNPNCQAYAGFEGILIDPEANG